MFKELRKRTGYSTDYAAKQLEVKKTTLYKYEEFHSLPSTTILLKMQELYKCQYVELLDAYKFAKEVYYERKNKSRNQQANRRWN